MSYVITEVDGTKWADELQRFNNLFSDEFHPLKPKHFERGFWWLVHLDVRVVGFAGMVPFDPFPRVGYLKRAAVLKEHRGKGIQTRLMAARETAALALTDWTHIVSECGLENVVSANNFIKAGYRMCEAERPWEKEQIFWIKELDRGAT